MGRKRVCGRLLRAVRWQQFWKKDVLKVLGRQVSGWWDEICEGLLGKRRQGYQAFPIRLQI